jgi:DNA-binding MarR family transcriptional regulator
MTQFTAHQDFEPAVLADIEDTADLQPALNQARQHARFSQMMIIRQALLARQQRGRFFSSKLFADPAWDMLLELYAASLTERRMCVSRVAERSGVALTTGLRWIKVLEEEGLIDRENDRFDQRRMYLSLSKKGRIGMNAYFEELHPDTKVF